MTCIQNPMTGEVRRLAWNEATAFIRYGWCYITNQAYRNAKAEQLRIAVRTPICKRRNINMEQLQ